MNAEVVRATEEDLTRPVLPEFATEGHATATDRKENSSLPEGTLRRHCLQVTTNVLRPKGVEDMKGR